jgi:subtilisin family serine protease
MSMRYVDKSIGAAVEMHESRTEFLMLTHDEREGVVLAPKSGLFSLRPSTNRDNVILLRLRSDNESTRSIENELTRLRENRSVREIVPALIDSDGETRFVVPGRVTLQIKPEFAGGTDSILETLSVDVVRRFRSPGLVQVAVPAGADIGEFIDRLNQDYRVALAEPSFYGVDDQEVRVAVELRRRPDAEGLEGEADTAWNLVNVGALQAWAVSDGDPAIVVAVVDGMPQIDHPALAGKFILPGDDANVFSADRSISSHATNIAGVIASWGRAKGVAPNVRILPVVVNLNSQDYAARADAIRYVAALTRAGRVGDTPISGMVLSCSWRTRGDVSVVRLALEDALDAGIPAVFSAGNDDTSESHYPSDYAASPAGLGAGLLSVAALNRLDQRAPYSNFSSKVSLSAPGGDGLPFDERDILCTDQSSAYVYAAGTSIAAPHVAATAALLLSVDPTLAASAVKNLLQTTARDISSSNSEYASLLGTGCVDAHAAVEAARRPDGSDVPSEYPDDFEPYEPSGAEPAATPVFIVSVSVPQIDRDIQLAKLRRCRDEIVVATGWSLIEAKLNRESQSVVLDVGVE